MALRDRFLDFGSQCRGERQRFRRTALPRQEGAVCTGSEKKKRFSFATKDFSVFLFFFPCAAAKTPAKPALQKRLRQQKRDQQRQQRKRQGAKLDDASATRSLPLTT